MFIPTTQLTQGMFSGVRLRLSANQLIDTEIFPGEVISWDTEDYDTNGYHAGGDPTKITFPSTAKYSVAGSGEWQTAGTTGVRALYVRLNGGSNIGAQRMLTGSQFEVNNFYLEREFSAGDYVEVLAYKQAGGTGLDIGGLLTWASARLIS